MKKKNIALLEKPVEVLLNIVLYFHRMDSKLEFRIMLLNLEPGTSHLSINTISGL